MSAKERIADKAVARSASVIASISEEQAQIIEALRERYVFDETGRSQLRDAGAQVVDIVRPLAVAILGDSSEQLDFATGVLAAQAINIACEDMDARKLAG